MPNGNGLGRQSIGAMVVAALISVVVSSVVGWL